LAFAAIIALGAALSMTAAQAAPKHTHSTGTASCTLVIDAAGDLGAAGGGLQAATSYQYELYDANHGALRGNQVTTDGNGAFYIEFGQASALSGVAPFTVEVYPIVGGKAHMDSLVASCSTS
jgi:hypothetical protein